MVVHFRTSERPYRHRVDAWSEVVGRLLLPLESRTSTEDFNAKMLVGDMGPLRICELLTPPGECIRPSRLIGEQNQRLYQIDVISRGTVTVEQNGRRAHLGAGDIAFTDPALPAAYNSSACTHVRLLFPRTMLALPATDAASMTAVRVAGDRGSGALVSSLSRQLPRHLDDYDPAEEARVAAAVIDLLTVALSAQLGRAESITPDTRRRALVHHIRAYIDAHLGDPRLNPAQIADAHHISLRYLHKLFESQETTLSSWIRRRRLERCRAALLDPAQSHRSANAIAAAWGMANPAHFNRAFKAVYGLPPGTYRAGTLAHQEPDGSVTRPRHR
ncbi:helix-turn-helix domain-containing protein [Cryptosporangium sp. NPDC048952]|uniref:AraC-like ligand-binding domain-containing protein n=1 Tax=Cryptosporangium sp. NPDC048952 TaxID=3363961 RepID=UPI003712F601